LEGERTETDHHRSVSGIHIAVCGYVMNQ